MVFAKTCKMQVCHYSEFLIYIYDFGTLPEDMM